MYYAIRKPKSDRIRLDVLSIYQAGYNSSSSLYDNISFKLGMTPKTYQKHGLATEIVYSIVACDLGYLLVATTDRGICAVKIGDCLQNLIETLTQEFSQATIIRDDLARKDWIESIFKLIAGTHRDLPLDIRGTSFQQQVWQELQKIPWGETRTYREIANNLGKPKATRAIGNACGANPVAIIIPCHRVVRSDGSLGGYRWGIEYKQKLLAKETPQQRGWSCASLPKPSPALKNNYENFRFIRIDLASCDLECCLFINANCCTTTRTSIVN